MCNNNHVKIIQCGTGIPLPINKKFNQYLITMYCLLCYIQLGPTVKEK